MGSSSNAKKRSEFKNVTDGWTDGWTDGPTDLPTDTARCRVACPRLKRGNNDGREEKKVLFYTLPRKKKEKGERDRHTNRQTGRHTNRQIGRQKYRQTKQS